LRLKGPDYVAKKPKPLATDARQVKPVLPLHVPIKLSFDLYKPGDTFCLSHCERDEVRIFMDCLRMLSQMTWVQVWAQGGKPGNKVGLAHTFYDDSSLNVGRPANVSPELKIVGLRASGKYRIFGVTIEQVFHVIWFDRNHDVVDG
jgi:hypothetical protein